MNTTILHEGVPLKPLWDHENYLFRVFKAHEAPKSNNDSSDSAIAVLPIKEFPNVRFLAMARDLPDVLASFYPFTAAHTEDFRALWGGFPPLM